MKEYRNFVGDPYLECCGGYYGTILPLPTPEPRKKAIVGVGMTALMIVGLIAAVAFAYKKLAK